MQYKAPEHFADGDSDSDEAEDETKTSPKVTYDKPADVYSFAMMCCQSNIVCTGLQLDTSVRINGATRLAVGTCDPCDVDTYAINGNTNCDMKPPV